MAKLANLIASVWARVRSARAQGVVRPGAWPRAQKRAYPAWNRLSAWSRLCRLTLLAVFGLILLLSLIRVLPKAPLAAAFPSSRSVLASQGELLRLTLASDEQYRLWTPLDEMAPALPEAVLLYEDRWFYWHPGINPVALVRASVATASGGRRIGASTITMQLARRVYQIDSRSLRGKAQQMLAALWLEARYSKREILEAYLNSAPYGGNVEGVGAASLTYWRKPAAALNVPEAINLAVIPQNPRKRQADSATHPDPEGLQQARLRLARAWAGRHPKDASMLAPALLSLPYQSRKTLPFGAPHWVDYLLKTSNERTVASTLDVKSQAVLERVMASWLRERASNGIQNASAILVDASTMEVKAMVGSSDYHNEAIAGQVNGVFAKRSPGSTLKPFIYAQAMDQGLIHSASILRDAPSNFGAYAPENFDGRFTGPISASQALIRSRNIPAVDLASRLSKPGLYDFLKMAGVQKLAPEAHYGLALALGGAEVTMEELAQLYAMLPNGGRWQPLRYQRAQKAPNVVATRAGDAVAMPGLTGFSAAIRNAASINQADQASPAPRGLTALAEPGLSLLSPEAAFITLDMLRQTPRPDTFAPAKPAIAWKTGTSWGFRDAWTAGVFGRHVLVVWVGNFDGSSNPAFIGVEAAAPMFMRMVDALRAEKLDPGAMASTQPAALQRVDVCVASGDLPNAECPLTAPAWLIAGKSPVRQSTLHRAVLVDVRTGLRACAPGPTTRREVFEFWPSDMQHLFKKAGLPLRQPPPGLCSDDESGSHGAPHIVSPLRGVTHLQRIRESKPLLLRAEVSAGGGRLSWFADDSWLGQTAGGESLLWQPPRAGRFVLRVVDANGLADSRELQVETVE